MKLRIRVIDVPANATAGQAEALLNAPYQDGFYLDKLIQLGLPDGVGTRGFFRLRMRPEHV